MSAAGIGNETPGQERAWHAVATVDEVATADRQPVAVQLLGEHWAIVRLPGAGGGDLRAFPDRCPHRLAPLSIGTVLSTGELQCRYHGWRYDGTGRCVAIPALGDDATIPPRAHLRQAWGVQERYGLVWLAPEEPVAALPEFPEWDDPSFDAMRNEPRRTPTGAHQLIDNFVDATHLPTVHTQTFGTDESPELPPYVVEHDGARAWTTYEVRYRNHDDPLVATGEHPLVQPQQLYKECSAATTTFIRLDFPLTGKTIAILFACQPERDGSTRIYKQMARNDFDGDADQIAKSIAFEDLVMDEDLAVLEPFHDRALRLDLTTEVHTKADRLSVAYRRILADLVTSAEG
jgi:phenylpropionate dioxygenase-like ring-hydroxylating dioxygenase large terminal subunit